MIDYYTGVLKNYAGFEGRARRAEYWQFALVNIIIIVLDVIGLAIKFPLLGLVYGLAVLVPSLAEPVERERPVCLRAVSEAGQVQLNTVSKPDPDNSAMTGPQTCRSSIHPCMNTTARSPAPSRRNTMSLFGIVAEVAIRAPC
jgi:hypothetical protein